MILVLSSSLGSNQYGSKVSELPYYEKPIELRLGMVQQIGFQIVELARFVLPLCDDLYVIILLHHLIPSVPLGREEAEPNTAAAWKLHLKILRVDNIYGYML